MTFVRRASLNTKKYCHLVGPRTRSFLKRYDWQIKTLPEAQIS